ncbi:MAG: hypothetical protein IT434_10085 [Phycisphaerales bacterium]|nr:hypothetical protein [Phycisphaerales bacterium]
MANNSTNWGQHDSTRPTDAPRPQHQVDQDYYRQQALDREAHERMRRQNEVADRLRAEQDRARGW